MSNLFTSIKSFIFPKPNQNKTIYYRNYEGASKSKRTENWITSSSSSNSELKGSLSLLRNRARDLVRNDPHAFRGIQAIVSNTISTGIIPQAKGINQKAQKLDELFKLWGDTTLCDADGQHDFYGLQSLVMKTVAESGECLIRKRRRRYSDNTTIPIQLQVIEPDYLDSSKEGVTRNGNRIVQGIEFNKIGKRVAYWLYKDHPGDSSLTTNNFSSIRVPAFDVLHIYRVDRPGQVRGMSWLAPALIPIKELSDGFDAELVRKKVANCFVAFVYNSDGNSDKKFIDKTLQPGTLQRLDPGEQITFSNPPEIEGLKDFSKIHLQRVAAGLGITYEVLTGDLSNVNFSSGRMGWIEFHRNIKQWRWQLIIPKMCAPIWHWFLEGAELLGYDTQGVGVTWTPPRREMIDPGKEISAMKSAIRSGLMSLSEAQRQLGYDPEDILDEMAADNKRLDKLGLVLDSDPRNQNKQIGSNKGGAN